MLSKLTPTNFAASSSCSSNGAESFSSLARLSCAARDLDACHNLNQQESFSPSISEYSYHHTISKPAAIKSPSSSRSQKIPNCESGRTLPAIPLRESLFTAPKTGDPVPGDENDITSSELYIFCSNKPRGTSIESMKLWQSEGRSLTVDRKKKRCLRRRLLLRPYRQPALRSLFLRRS
jgi:hypothetical protein